MKVLRLCRAIARRVPELPGIVSRRISGVIPVASQPLATLALWPTLLRETRVVVAGQRAYLDAEKSGQQVYELRRRIHMLEKGLVMRPRRSTFATDYIGATVRAAGDIRHGTPHSLSEPEWDWVFSVLSDYFAATASSDAVAIRRSRDAYASLVSTQGEHNYRGPKAPTTTPPPVDFDALKQLAMNRASVRWFLPKTVDRQLVDDAIEVAMEAPSACNRQPYQFRVIDDPDLLAQVVKVPMGTHGFGHGIPTLTVVVGNMAAFSHERDRHLIYIDSCLATMSLIFALQAHGLSTCCINWPEIPNKERKMSQILGLAPHERVIMLVAIGYADPTGLAPYSQKRQLEDVRRFN